MTLARPIKQHLSHTIFLFVGVFSLVGCGSDNIVPEPDPLPEPSASDVLVQTIESATGQSVSALVLPASDDYSAIPQDPNNPITEEKVILGQLLFHETALATEGVNTSRSGTWSCASCHHAAAGFKAGIPQGIGEGGDGFGVRGEGRLLATGFDGNSTDPTLVPDTQPFASPTILNGAYQEVMLWNGQFGAQEGGNVNINLPPDVLASPGTPKAENVRQLAGLEIQAVAGTGVHRLNTSDNSVLQTNGEYIAMFTAAYPDGSNDVLEDASKAIAAYERTVLANEAPFQQWLAGDSTAMSDDEIAGATLFFGKAQCGSCHQGPALSSQVGVGASEMFMAIGFADLDIHRPDVTGRVTLADSRGRGGFTRNAEDDYKFKVPQLYNLLDSDVFGHGASFTSVRDVVAYKNAGVPQKALVESVLDPRFVPLGLTEDEVDLITIFLESALYDANLLRYQPSMLPSGNCLIVADEQSRMDLNC